MQELLMLVLHVVMRYHKLDGQSACFLSRLCVNFDAIAIASYNDAIVRRRRAKGFDHI